MEILDFLIEPYKGYSSLQIFLEATAAILGILSVCFSMKKNILVYPTGIASTAIYVYLLFDWGLYGDTLINAYYFSMSIYGWYFWSRVGDNQQVVPVTKMTGNEKLTACGIFFSSILLVLVIYHFKPYIESGFLPETLNTLKAPFYWLTETEIPFDIKIQYIDTLTTAIFFVGMWLMARKKLENWIFWIIGDCIAIPMYLSRGYGITAFQYLIFLIPAIAGYFIWRKDILKNSQKESLH